MTAPELSVTAPENGSGRNLGIDGVRLENSDEQKQAVARHGKPPLGCFERIPISAGESILVGETVVRHRLGGTWIHARSFMGKANLEQRDQLLGCEAAIA
jgi:hypothetical protein